jgi:hypothetical protein
MPSTRIEGAMKEWQKALLTLLGSIAVFLLTCEIVLRFLPVRSGFETPVVDIEHPYLHHKPNFDYVFSDGALLTNVNRGHSNNYGAINDQDYDPKDPRPLLAVIGDSYIEAAMIPFPQTIAARLSADASPQRRVYSFGNSGASLADYLAYSEFVHNTFNAQWMVVNVVANDFDEMLLRYKREAAFHYYVENPDGTLRLTLLEYHSSWLSAIAHRSALGRYLVLNIGTTPIGFRIHNLLKFGHFNGVEAEPAPDPERIAWSKRAVDQVLSEFPVRSGLEPSHILFLIDSYRVFDPTEIAAQQQSFFGVMRAYFIAEAHARGFEVADLQDWFSRRHEADGAVFQFPDDGHWNATGHEEATKAVLASRVWRDFQAQ